MKMACAECGRLFNARRDRQFFCSKNCEALYRGEKRCCTCGHTKPLAEFPAEPGNSGNKRARCLTCNRRSVKESYNRTKEQFHRRHVERTYGIHPDIYDWLLAAQGGVCAICGEPPSGKRRRLAVDHDHATGAVRGLLCSACNTALGGFRDSRELLKKATEYLAQFNSDEYEA